MKFFAWLFSIILLIGQFVKRIASIMYEDYVNIALVCGRERKNFIGGTFHSNKKPLTFLSEVKYYLINLFNASSNVATARANFVSNITQRLNFVIV